MSKALLSKKEPELEDSENPQPIHISESEKGCSKGNTKGVAEQPFDKQAMGVSRGFNQPFSQKPGIELGLHQQRSCQFELKGIEKNELK